MNSAPVEGAERIRAEADPNRGPRPELFKGSARGWVGFLPSACASGELHESTTEGTMKFSVATITALASTPALADAGHFTAERGHTHWLALGALALALVIGGIALAKSRRHRADANKTISNTVGRKI